MFDVRFDAKLRAGCHFAVLAAARQRADEPRRDGVVRLAGFGVDGLRIRTAQAITSGDLAFENWMSRIETLVYDHDPRAFRIWRKRRAFDIEQLGFPQRTGG